MTATQVLLFTFQFLLSQNESKLNRRIQPKGIRELQKFHAICVRNLQSEKFHLAVSVWAVRKKNLKIRKIKKNGR